ncbi:cAMP-regulated phosphoprotein 19-related protein [Euphorbia peplus]|nr:cAMP-regulated phosphoprotein 19-related protein [Euphorbia peplus]
MSEIDDAHNNVAVVQTNVLKEVKDCAENPMLSPQLHEEEEMIKKRYGGILPKKKPLISKDHEHAFFDSADWALGKQGQAAHTNKPKAPAEALRPKLEPTRQQQVRSRRSSYAPPHQSDCDSDSDVVDGGGNPPSEHENDILLVVAAAADHDINNIDTHTAA